MLESRQIISRTTYGYFIAGELFYPGDAYTNPEKEVLVLALPVAGPWCKASDSIKYAKKIKPSKAFPVHDAVLNADGITLTHGLFSGQLAAANIEFVALKNGESADF